MDAVYQLFLTTINQVALTFVHNWPFLIISVIIAVALKLYIDPKRVSEFLMRHKRAGVVSATVAAVATPLCSCGTTAIILGMMASMMPWAPIVAFMVASPLTSPEELIYSAGLFGWPFALTFFAASIFLGLLGGAAAIFFEARGLLKNQTRFTTPADSGVPAEPEPEPACSCGTVPEPEPACACGGEPQPAIASASPSFRQTSLHVQPVLSACACSTGGEMALELQPAAALSAQPSAQACACSDSTPASPARKQVTLRAFTAEALTTGKRLLLMFFGFAFIGYFLNGLIPSAWVSAIFGPGSVYSIPLAATLGLPLYVNTEASLPLVRALLDGGMSQGAALAFLITGAGTSVGAIAGALTIARWRVIALVIGTLWVGAVISGYIYNLLLSTGII